MTVVGAYEAKTHLPRLLDEVSGGGTVTITKHGVPIARLVPVEETASNPGRVIEELRAARAGVRLGELTLREMIDEGRA